MVKYFFAFCFCFFSSFAFAKPVPMLFEAVKLPLFLQAVYGDILKKNYVLSPELITSTRAVTLKATVEDSQFPVFISGFLERMGITQSESDGVIYLSPASNLLSSASQSLPAASLPALGVGVPLPSVASLEPLAGDLFVYTPKRLSNDALCAYVNALFRDKSCVLVGVSAVFKLPSKELAALRDLLPDIDKVLPRVLVTVSLVEVVSGQSNSFGLSLAGNVLGGAFKVSPSTLTGAGALSITGTHASLVLDQLLSDSRFKQLSSPSALALAGERFNINVGDRSPTLGAVTQSGVGASTQSIVYQESGVTLDALPSVVMADDGFRVYLDLSVLVSSFKATTTGVNGSPTISQRKLKTNVSLASDEVVVLGGLTSKSATDTGARLFGVLPVGSSSQSADLDLLMVVSARVVE